MVLNERQDYFGQTVNIASRVQSVAESRAIFVTQPVVAHSELSRSRRSSPRWRGRAACGRVRVIDCDSDLDLTPVHRVAYMLNKGYLFGSHFLPHDALATQKSGKTFLNELNEVGLRNCKAVPRTHDIWIGINRLRQILPRFSFRIPACERLLEET